MDMTSIVILVVMFAMSATFIAIGLHLARKHNKATGKGSNRDSGVYHSPADSSGSDSFDSDRNGNSGDSSSGDSGGGSDGGGGGGGD